MRLATAFFSAAMLAAGARFEGLIVEIEPSQGIIVVAHSPTKNMPAMTMPLRVTRGVLLAGLQPGMRIRFTLSKTKIADIQILKSDFGESIRIPEPANQLKIGDLVPDFALTDQDGNRSPLLTGTGVTVVNFIYTRCPMPDVCPRLTANFAYLSKRLPQARLLTITLDPTHDTPEVLKAYAAHLNTRNWRFLTGDESRIRDIGGLFGLVYWPEDGVITHTSSTAVIGIDGRLRAIVQGTSYRPDQLLALVTSVLESRN